MKAPRIAGYEIAHAFALFVLVGFSFAVVLGENSTVLGREEYLILPDSAAALVFFLTGLGISLQASFHSKKNQFLKMMMKKGALFLAIGLLTLIIWPVNIFLSLGILIMAGSLLVSLSSTLIRILIALTIFVTLIIFFRNDSEMLVQMRPFLSVKENPRTIVSFIGWNSYYSVIPWSIFFFSGLLFGRAQMRRKNIRFISNRLASIGLLIVILLEYFGTGFMAEFNESIPVSPIWGPSWSILTFIPGAICLSILSLNGTTYLAENYNDSKAVQCLGKIGKLKYSIYVLHMLIGASCLYTFNTNMFVSNGTHFLLFLGFVLLSIFLSRFWLKQFNLGPIEKMIRKLAG